MSEREYSVTRTKATWKPRVVEEDLRFSSAADRIALDLGPSEQALVLPAGRAPLLVPPYSEAFREASASSTVSGHETVQLLTEPPEGLRIDYRILGGYNSNAVECTWRETGASEFTVAWVALKTFTGMQLKYLTPKKRNRVLFALADEDAYVYCDEDPCLECIFMCKRGFVLYVNVKGVGIVSLPLSRAQATGNPENR